MTGQPCFRESRIDNNLTCFSLRSHNERATRLEGTMQIGLVLELPPSGGYENIFTATDAFRFILAYTMTRQDARTTAGVIVNILCSHAHLTTRIISDRGSAFVSQSLEEVGDFRGIIPEHAREEHAQTIGMLARMHASH